MYTELIIDKTPISHTRQFSRSISIRVFLLSFYYCVSCSRSCYCFGSFLFPAVIVRVRRCLKHSLITVRDQSALVYLLHLEAPAGSVSCYFPVCPDNVTFDRTRENGEDREDPVPSSIVLHKDL